MTTWKISIFCYITVWVSSLLAGERKEKLKHAQNGKKREFDCGFKFMKKVLIWIELIKYLKTGHLLSFGHGWEWASWSAECWYFLLIWLIKVETDLKKEKVIVQSTKGVNSWGSTTRVLWTSPVPSSTKAVSPSYLNNGQWIMAIKFLINFFFLNWSCECFLFLLFGIN